ncbi:TetR/AcrR family transcriptional regulator [bacterium]|jgi:AcrR family transcriptional regulator|nr:TetR/AcrR family transcriptional regulator [bacterium]NBW57128.1 TetR/AcrR family transcriptional regulator [bacterium]NBX71904.1 TetR/AcrR family transcriptional regulator [bacterium]
MELGMDEMTKNLWQSIVKSPMTHKPPERKRQDKKHKLVLAAKALVYKKGFSETTLADIAHQADVPLGNVYYYFKTKEAIGLAVIEQRFKEWETWRRKVATQPLVLSRLMMFLESFMTLQTDNDFGCPIGHLCQEFAREGGALGIASRKFLMSFVAWLEEQFRLLGLAELSLSTANTFLSLSQGAILLAQTLQEPTIMDNQRYFIERWLKQIDRQNIHTFSSIDMSILRPELMILE